MTLAFAVCQGKRERRPSLYNHVPQKSGESCSRKCERACPLPAIADRTSKILSRGKRERRPSSQKSGESCSRKCERACPLPAIADRTSKILSRLKTSALVLSGIRPRIKHSHKTLGLRPRVLCSCLMLGLIPDKTAASVFNPYIKIPYQWANMQRKTWWLGWMHLTDGLFRCKQATNTVDHIQPGAVKLVLCSHWLHLSFMHQVTSENQFHCTRL